MIAIYRIIIAIYWINIAFHSEGVHFDFPNQWDETHIKMASFPCIDEFSYKTILIRYIEIIIR